MLVISVVNEKGGVGKTTIAVHLAGWLKKQGLSCAMIDADTQGGSSLWMGEADPEMKVFRCLTRREIVTKANELLEAEDFQVLVIDAPGGLNDATIGALYMSNLALIPCGPSILDVRASSQSIEAVKEARMATRSNLPEAMFVPNKTHRNYQLSDNLIKGSKQLEGVVVTPPMRNLQAYAKAPQKGKFVWDLGRPGDDASIEIHTMFNFIKNHYAERKDQ